MIAINMRPQTKIFGGVAGHEFSSDGDLGARYTVTGITVGPMRSRRFILPPANQLDELFKKEPHQLHHNQKLPITQAINKQLVVNNNNNMKLNVILFALVCLGLLALALAHDGESPPRSSTNTLPH
jgi:hypothetical protein